MLTNAQMDFLLANTPWWPQEGPQEHAFDSLADMVLYGGAAGGGKTSLAVGLAIISHRQTLFVRRESTQLGGVLDEVARIIDPERAGYSGQTKEWKIPTWDGVRRKIVFGSTPNPGDETKYQGRERDLLVIDEAANMLESQCAFLRGWVRTTHPSQRTRILLCSNPPTGAEGEWLIRWFAPWLDPNHANPAVPGELRWYTTLAGKDEEVPNGDPVEIEGEMIYPKSRTFIPAKVQDNKYLGIDYLAELQALPEPLRSQMLYGDFTAGREDSEWQVIPSDWVAAAQARWRERPYLADRITSMGVDPSRGGRDQTIVASREGWHFHKLHEWDGAEMPNGGAVASAVVNLVGTSPCPVHIDVIGIGASVLDNLDMLIGSRAVGVNSSHAAKTDTDWSGRLKFSNKRAQLWWQLRDLLNPENGTKVSLPPDAQLRADLCAPTYTLAPAGIKVESKEHIVKRLGRSPDKGDAVVYCAERTAVLTMHGSRQGSVRPHVRVHGSMGT